MKRINHLAASSEVKGQGTPRMGQRSTPLTSNQTRMACRTSFEHRGASGSSVTLVEITSRLDDPAFLDIIALSVFRPTEEKMAAKSREWTSNPAVHAYVALHNGDPAGAAVFEMNPGGLEILGIAVIPDVRFRGVGRSLILGVRERFPGLDLVAETDGEAVGFYKSLGFSVKDLGEKYPGTVRYRCRLRAEFPRHHRTLSAVMLFLTRYNESAEELLLQRRQNTGYSDGMWDCAASGHVDMGESMTAAVIREAEEELGISIAPEDVRFCTMTHKNWSDTGEVYDDVYYNAYFIVDVYKGCPEIREPEKCSELRWFKADSLPPDLIPDRVRAWLNFKSGIPYSEEGWKTN